MDFFPNTDNGSANASPSVAVITELAQARLDIERLTTELQALRSAHRGLVNSMQEDLEEFASNNLQPGGDDYKELSELMVNNGLTGLKRTFKVTVQVHYEFEVEVEASDEDEARDDVDNNLSSFISDHMDSDDYYDYDIEAEEA